MGTQIKLTREIPAEPMILVGGTARNTGKSALVTRLISEYSKQGDVIAAKVITVRNHGDTCPRGGRGCGICAGLQDIYDIREEDGNGNKDTMLFRKAGAQRVYLVRAYHEGLFAAAAELLRRVKPGEKLVCESNSLRTVVKPGLFYMILDNLQDIKPSAKEVLAKADYLLEPFADSIVEPLGSF